MLADRWAVAKMLHVGSVAPDILEHHNYYPGVSKVCKVIALLAALKGFGPLYYIIFEVQVRFGWVEKIRYLDPLSTTPGSAVSLLEPSCAGSGNPYH